MKNNNCIVSFGNCEFEITKEQAERIINSPGISKEYLEECKRVSQMFKKPDTK